MDTVQAGWASGDITPDIPCSMGGYAARTEPANAVHDPLWANALALGSPQNPFVIVVCDLVAIDDAIVGAVRQRVGAEVAGATVWLSATHTHSGPMVGGRVGTGDADPKVVERVIAGATRAALDAIGGMHAVHAGWASGPIGGIATNRDHPEGGEITSLDLLCLYDGGHDASNPAAIFGSFPCHPTVLGADNLAISADLPGAFRRQLQAGIKGRDTWVALATGASGDISTRHARRGQDFEELERLGRLLAEQAQGVLRGTHPLQLAMPIVREERVPLERKALLDAASLEAAATAVEEQRVQALRTGNPAEARTLETTLQGIRAASRSAETPADVPEAVTITTASLGDLKTVAIPGELYHQLGEELRHHLGPAGLLLGYTNGYLGYLPTREAYGTMDYEVLMSPFVAGTGERIVAAALDLLTEEKDRTR